MNKPMWRNWQTHMTQNHAGNHVGSSPTLGTKKIKSTDKKSVLFIFLVPKVGLEKEWLSCGEVKADPERRQKMSSGHFLRRGLPSPILCTIL